MSAEKGAINRMYNRMLNVLGRGKITFVDDSGAIQKIQTDINAGETRDNTPLIMHYGFTYNPPLQSDIALGFLSGDRSIGFGFGTNNQTMRPRNLVSGEAMMYNGVRSTRVYLADDGIHIVAAGMPVTIDDADLVTINASTSVTMNTPLLQVSGDIIDNYTSQADNMAGMRERYNTHTHGDVENGPGITSVPNNLE